MNIIEECSGAKRIGISGHIRPDGDAVGACLSLYLYLKKNLAGDPYVGVYLEEPAPQFNAIKGFDRIITDFPTEEAFDVYFALDCSKDRIGDAIKYFDNAKKTINIDHHITNTGSGMINVMEPESGSVCEVIYDLFDKDKIDADIAKALYIGIIHDTGVFQYSNTRPSTLTKAAHLISYGFDFPKIIEETFYQKTYVQSQITGRALVESIRFMNGKCAVSVIDRKTMDFYDADNRDLEGIINHLRRIKGVECAIFMYETGPLEYKVSLRTTEKVDATKVVTNFGGGGHARAAGCTMHGTFHDNVNNLSKYIAAQLGEE
ncbi:MAG: DHH family phosphoesterase [Acetatifactor sp.]|nr:DHH family phosphoesterase [Acetatifactor sp.]